MKPFAACTLVATLGSQVPIDIGRDEARSAARRELSKQEYQADQPGLVERALRWVWDQVSELLDKAANTAPFGWAGLAVIAALRLQGIGPIVASDFSPKRRALAEHLGADVVVDPAKEKPVAVWQKAAGGRLPLFFECVGVPGMIGELLRTAPRGARIVVAGVCMQMDQIRPMHAINKELSLQFVLGYTPEEFAGTLRALAEGKIPAEPLITGRVDIPEVAEAFRALRDPEAHAKILVEPRRA